MVIFGVKMGSLCMLSPNVRCVVRIWSIFLFKGRSLESFLHLLGIMYTLFAHTIGHNSGLGAPKFYSRCLLLILVQFGAILLTNSFITRFFTHAKCFFLRIHRDLVLAFSFHVFNGCNFFNFSSSEFNSFDFFKSFEGRLCVIGAVFVFSLLLLGFA